MTENPEGTTDTSPEIATADAFEAAMKAYKAESGMSDTPDTPPETVQDIVQTEAEVVPETPPEPPAPKEPEEAPTAALRRMMARDKELRELKTKLDAEKQEIESFRAQKAEFERNVRTFEIDPVAYIRALNPKISLAEIAKQLWLEELGDAAPPEHRTSREVRTNRTEIERLRMELEAERARLAEEQNAARAEAAYAQYAGALEAYAKSAPDTVPLVKAYTAADPTKVVRGMLKIAEAASRDGTILTPEQCAQQLETKLAALRKALVPEAPKSAPAVAQTPATPQTSKAPTLRNQHQSIQPNRAPEDDEEALFKKAMASALASVRTQ